MRANILNLKDLSKVGNIFLANICKAQKKIVPLQEKIMNTSNFSISVKKVTQSKLPNIDFSKLAFGHIFSDHMFVCDYKDGKWQNPRIERYAPFLVAPSMSVFHYGQAVFEGMKAYKDDKGDVFLFRPTENYARMNKSCRRMAIPEFPEELFDQGLKTLVTLDKDWVQPGVGNSLYLRPFVIATSEGVQANPATEYRFMIITSPVQSYYTTKEVKVKIADHYSRAANGGFGFAKAAGNYAGQFYPTALAKEEGFQQIIWTDDATHELLEECGTMNVVFRIGDTLVSPPPTERILDGVTRKSVLAVAEKLGIDFQSRPITVTELIEAAENGTLQEIFGCGTAAVISPVTAFNYKSKDYQLPTIEKSYASQIKEILINIQYNKAEDPFGWRVKI